MTTASRPIAFLSDFRTQLGVPMDPRGWLTVVRGNPASALEGLGVDIGDQVWVSGNAAPAD